MSCPANRNREQKKRLESSESIGELRKLYHHFPKLWEQLQRWDDITWRKFHPDYSVRELQIRFDFEDECLKEGKPIKDKAFYSALRERLKAYGDQYA